MKNRKMIHKVLVNVLLGGCMLFSLFGCRSTSHYVDEVKTENSSSSVSGAAQELYMENVLDIFDWIGKTPDEIEIADRYLDSRDVIHFSGELFGSPVKYGTVAFLTDYATGRLDADHIYCSCSELSFEEAEEKFTQVYGQPYESGEEPYVKVNDGAVAWVRFYTGAGTVQLSHPSEGNYIFIDVTPSAPPDDYVYTMEEE